MRLFLCIAILCVCTTARAQQSHVRLAGTVGLNGNLGYSNPDYAITVGGDLRRGRFDLSLDGSLIRIRKNTGGSGFQVSARELGRYYFGKYFIQGGSDQWHYSVTQFSKSGVGVIAGGGFSRENFVVQVNYRQLIQESSRPKGLPNRNKGVEFKTEAFLKRHLYLATSLNMTNFTSGLNRMTGASVQNFVGVWFK